MVKKLPLLSLLLCTTLILPASASPSPPLEQAAPVPIEFPVKTPGSNAGPMMAPDAHNVELVGQIGGESNALALQGDYVYIGLGPRLIVVEVSNPAQPSVVGRTTVLPYIVEGVAVSGSYAYVADGPAGVRIIDVSDPSTPTEVGSCDTPGRARDVVVAGSHAYVADYDGGLRVLDVSDPAAPGEIGFCATSGKALDVAVSGGYAYVADWDGGLRVIDVSSPAAPTQVGFYDTPGRPHGVAVSGGYAYVADGDGGLRIVNVSDPSAPSEVGSCDVPEFACGVAVAGNYAYVAAADDGLRIVDVSMATMPSEVGYCLTWRTAWAVVVAEDHAYVADWWGGVCVIDVANPAHPIRTGSSRTLGDASAIALAGGYAYVADWDAGLRVIDVSSPAQPIMTGSYEARWWSYGVAVSGHYAYVAHRGSGLRIVDVSDPAAPIEVGRYDTPRGAEGVAVAGDYAYVAHWNGLHVINVLDPAAPSEVGYCDTPEGAQGVAVSATLAYVANYHDGLRVIDVSDPAAPTQVGFYDTQGMAWAVVVTGNYAYVTDGGHGLRIIDVSNPASPVEAGFYDTPGWAYGLAIADDHAYVADATALRILDVSDPTAPIEVGFYETPGYTRAVALDGDYAYVADDQGGLVILRFTGGVGPELTPPTIRLVEPENPASAHISRDLCPGSIALEVGASVCDTQSGLDWVRLCYDIDGVAQPCVESDLNGEVCDNFWCALGPFPQPATVHFYLEARDMVGNETRVPPLGTDPYVLIVDDCPGCTSYRVETFSPPDNGFRFGNFGNPGYCTGMSASAIDYFEYQERIPSEYNKWSGWGTDPDNPLSCYIKRRHLAVNVATIGYAPAQWIAEPIRGLRNLKEYNKIKAQIEDEGGVAHISLGFFKPHVVTVYACTECTDGRVALFAYDSNKVYRLRGAHVGVTKGRLTSDGLVIDSTSTGDYESIFADFTWLLPPVLPHYPDLSSCDASYIDQAVDELTASGWTGNSPSMVESTLAAGEQSQSYEFWNDSRESSAVSVSWGGGTLCLSVYHPDGAPFTEVESDQSPLIAYIPSGQSEGIWSYRIAHPSMQNGAAIRGDESYTCISMIAYPQEAVLYLPVIWRQGN